MKCNTFSVEFQSHNHINLAEIKWRLFPEISWIFGTDQIIILIRILFKDNSLQKHPQIAQVEKISNIKMKQQQQKKACFYSSCFCNLLIQGHHEIVGSFCIINKLLLSELSGDSFYFVTEKDFVSLGKETVEHSLNK